MRKYHNVALFIKKENKTIGNMLFNIPKIKLKKIENQKKKFSQTWIQKI